LKFSRHLVVILVADQTAETLVRCVVACCRIWGGSPLAWVFDNPKTVVISKRDAVIELNPHLRHLAGELRASVELCSPRSGNQKGSVERGVGWVKNSFLRVRTFVDRADLESQLAAWLTEVNERRPCDATKEIPSVRLRQEADRLATRPVPWTADEYPLRESGTVTPVATVVCRQTPYQVDAKAIGTVATVLVRRQSIEVITVRGTRVTHPRRDGQRNVQRLPGQAPVNRLRRSTGCTASGNATIINVNASSPWVWTRCGSWRSWSTPAATAAGCLRSVGSSCCWRSTATTACAPRWRRASPAAAATSSPSKRR
jgi:hypothetical protein